LLRRHTARRSNSCRARRAGLRPQSRCAPLAAARPHARGGCPGDARRRSPESARAPRRHRRIAHHHEGLEVARRAPPVRRRRTSPGNRPAPRPRPPQGRSTTPRRRAASGPRGPRRPDVGGPLVDEQPRRVGPPRARARARRIGRERSRARGHEQAEGDEPTERRSHDAHHLLLRASPSSRGREAHGLEPRMRRRGSRLGSLRASAGGGYTSSAAPGPGTGGIGGAAPIV
jgi:hypothetical protein